MFFVSFDFSFEGGLSLKKYKVESLSNNTVTYKKDEDVCMGGKLSQFTEAKEFSLSYKLILKNSKCIMFYVLVDEDRLNDLTNFVTKACNMAVKEHIEMCLDSLTDVRRVLDETITL